MDGYACTAKLVSLFSNKKFTCDICGRYLDASLFFKRNLSMTNVMFVKHNLTLDDMFAQTLNTTNNTLTNA